MLYTQHEVTVASGAADALAREEPPVEKTVGSATAPDETLRCDVAVIGGGIAGLTLALSLPPALSVILVTKSALGESNTRYAQGGLAAAVGVDDDPELHLRDTLAAGAGLVVEPAARILVTEAAEALAWLIAHGAAFDQREPGAVLTGDAPSLGSRYAL